MGLVVVAAAGDVEVDAPTAVVEDAVPVLLPVLLVSLANVVLVVVAAVGILVEDGAAPEVADTTPKEAHKEVKSFASSVSSSAVLLTNP